MSVNYGASLQEWVTLHVLLGLTPDLLPVVANPNSEISPNSKMKDKGKTPSRYNKSRHVTGFAKWTEHHTTPAEVESWVKEPDYGVCIQTRKIRAFDIDIADPSKAARIKDFILSYLDFPLPERYRENSGKCLLAFKLPGEYAKHIIKTPYGNIEFLATGQQFVACGTHTSGVRYAWRGGLPDEIPELSAEKFAQIWAALKKYFAIEETEKERGVRKNGQDIGADDAIAGVLTHLGWGSQGQIFIECPFKDEHTTDSGDSETAYFPKGTRGYEQGHFVCLHAHCADRTDAEFEDALGLRDNEFEVIIPEEIDGNQIMLPPDRPIFRRSSAKSSEVLATIDNLLLAVARPDICGLRVAYDRFRDDILVGEPDSSAPLRPLVDKDYTFMQNLLERKIGFRSISLDLLRRAVESVAHEFAFDSAVDWLKGLKWDGVNRIDSFMHRYMGATGSPYHMAVSRYMWTALAGRTLCPGIKADMVPIFVGEQGIMKSSAVAAFAPTRDAFVNISLGESDDNLSRKMKGKQVAEIGELRGLHTRELEAIKEFIVKTHDEWVPKYKECRVVFARRLVFIGTTNSRQFLADESGNRRWLPVDVEGVNIRQLLIDRDQLWAEARDLFLADGIAYEDAERLAKEVHDNYMIVDPWEEFILQWLNTADEMDGHTPSDCAFITTESLLKDALGFDTRQMRGITEGKRVGTIMRKLNYSRKKARHNGRMVWGWEKPIAQRSEFC